MSETTDEWADQVLDDAGVPSYWSYGVTRQTVDGETIYAIRELYFAHPGELTAWSNHVAPVAGETPEELWTVLERMREAFESGHFLDIDTKEWL